MDITIARRDLLALVKRAAPVAPAKSTNPVLSNVLLDATADGLRVAATDLYLSVSGSCAAEVRRTGAVAVSAKDMLSRVGMMPDGPLLVKVEGASLVLKAAGSARRYTLHSVAGTEFPKLPEPTADAPRFTLVGKVLSGLLARVVFCVSADDTRPNLNSALVEIKDGTIRLVSTDGHRLAKVEAKLDAPDATLLLPLSALRVLEKIGHEAEGDVSISTVEAMAFFESGGSIFGVKLVEAQFPSYSKVIPKDLSKNVTVARNNFAEMLKAVGLAASDKTGGIQLTLAPGLLRVTSENATSGDGFDEMPIDYQGEEMTIGFKGQYLEQALAAMASDEAVLGLGGPLDPGTLRPSVQAEGEDFVAVVMPMRI